MLMMMMIVELVAWQCEHPFQRTLLWWTKFSHVEIKFIRLEICTIYQSDAFKHSLSSNTLSLSLSVQTLSLSNTHSNTQISHPQPLGVQQKSPSPSNALFFLTIGFRLENPIPWKSLFLTIVFTLTHTLKIPFVPTNGSSDFFKFEGRLQSDFQSDCCYWSGYWQPVQLLH